MQLINVGAAANDQTGDPLRSAFVKANDNFADLDGRLAGHAAAADPHPQYATPAEAAAAAPVQSVAGRVGAVALTAGDVAGAARLAGPQTLTGGHTFAKGDGSPLLQIDAGAESVDVGGTLTAGAVNVNSLNVTGDVQFFGGVSADGPVSVGGTLTAGGDVETGGDLFVGKVIFGDGSGLTNLPPSPPPDLTVYAKLVTLQTFTKQQTFTNGLALDGPALFRAATSTGTVQVQAEARGGWADGTDASRRGRMTLGVYQGSTFRPAVVVDAAADGHTPVEVAGPLRATTTGYGFHGLVHRGQQPGMRFEDTDEARGYAVFGGFGRLYFRSGSAGNYEAIFDSHFSSGRGNIAVRAAAGQAHALTEWQDAGGVTRTSIDAGFHLVLSSPNGTRYRVRVSDAGALSAEPA